MTIIEMRDWFAVVAGPGLSALSLVLLTRAKSKIDHLAISVDGRLSELLASKAVESKARISEAAALGEASGREAERSGVTHEDLLAAIVKKDAPP